MVVSDSGVRGAYNALEDAKAVLSVIKSGNRLIAEVDAKGILNTDPHTINGYHQSPDIGFNSYWCGWSCINSLIDICQTFLDSGGK